MNTSAKNSGEKKKTKNPRNNEKFDLFVYGTLLNDHHVELLLHRKVETVPAVLYHYMRIVPKGGFAFLVKRNDAKTNGRILKDLAKEEIERIDSFEDEGHLYFRKSVCVRVGEKKQRCMTYIGNISALNESFWNEVAFEDRFSMFIEKKIDNILAEMDTDRPDITRRVLHELMSSEADSIIQSHFDGNYICNYIMIQAFEEAKPPNLSQLLETTPEMLPYAGNYMRLACQHIVFNQFVELIRHQFPDAVRLSQQYFRHGLAVLMAFIYYNGKKTAINKLFSEKGLDRIVGGRSYRDYARIAIDIVDIVYHKKEMKELVSFIRRKWYSTPTPLGAELEFSYLGVNAINAAPGADKVYDSFHWFTDFDLLRRTWRLGGHVDSHRTILAGQRRHRGFFEYALGRYQILGDLSRPLFDCPWGMSLLINEAVKFLDIPPHSLHISLELTGSHSHITDRPHKEEHLACLLMLGGDLRPDASGKLREWRVFNNELDTNFQKSIHFSDRKCHFSKPEQEQSEASEVMEYKFLRLHKEETDYESLIIALKGYQRETHARPVSIREKGCPEMPEQVFLRKWAAKPQSLDKTAINDFLTTVEKGLLEENKARKLEPRKIKVLEKLGKYLSARNKMISEYEKR